MSREIKFRAWKTEFTRVGEHNIGKMAYDIVLANPIGNNADIRVNDILAKTHNLMQYTGLKDKNGKEIYEGDICKVINYASDYLKVRGKMYCVISWSNTTGFYGKGFGIPTTFSIGEEFEVIGNIYENPELLKEAK